MGSPRIYRGRPLWGLPERVKASKQNIFLVFILFIYFFVSFLFKQLAHQPSWIELSLLRRATAPDLLHPLSCLLRSSTSHPGMGECSTDAPSPFRVR